MRYPFDLAKSHIFLNVEIIANVPPHPMVRPCNDPVGSSVVVDFESRGKRNLAKEGCFPITTSPYHHAISQHF